MKVKELIKVLETLPEDLEVFAFDCEYGYYLMDKVITGTVVETGDDGKTLLSPFDFMDEDDVKVGQKFIGLSFNSKH